ncbi:MAG: flotillin family protein [Anaerolineae bacterium]
MPGGMLAAIGILGLFFVVLVTAFVFAGRYIKVGPNEVLVISGRKRHVLDPATGEKVQRNFRLLKGGGTFIIPVLERVDELSLELMTIDVVTTRVYTIQGVPVTVDGVAQVKIRGDDVSIFTAAEQFLSKSTAEIKNVALQTLEGHLRAILGTMTVEEVYRDRDSFAQKVQEVAAGDLANMGLTIISFTIRDIRDDEGYLDSLGKARTAEVKRDAAIGEANAQRDARIEASRAMQAAREAELTAETHVAEADKNFKVQKASYDAEVNQRNAEAELAYTLQQNITNQKVRAEALNIEIVEKEKRVALQEKEIERRERELEATVRKPAEAKQYEIETLARAKRTQLETEAEGEAAAKRSVGVGEADANRARGLADADVAKALGMAEADVIKAQGISEAEAKRLKAEAWKQYGQAAIIEQLVTNLPALAAAAAEPLAKTERIVVIGGGDGTSSGASKVVGDVTNIVAQMPAVLEALTGVDLISVLNSLPALQGQAAAGALADGADGAGAGAGEDGTDATDDSSDSDA